MQCIQGHILSSMIPRHGEESLSQVAQTQVGQEHWCWGHTTQVIYSVTNNYQELPKDSYERESSALMEITV